MAKINLREYLDGIEEMIDSGQIEESLAHCRHILKTYPKHVDTYRMMGKAYLEAKRHGEASDIFQRVLSSSPDDFVAHIGMSIIREDEGNQDAAIWHMERAFESQPSNRAVQDELRRLYGDREGFEPPKVRLTRGALARMYAHGDLYAQAISELRSALNEDTQRPDLQVLLARMYYLTKRNTDAIEVCTHLLEKLPYCLYANHLMADILNEDDHPDQAQPYLGRVEELDPYAAQITTLEFAENVPADSVMVEHMVVSGAAPRAEAARRSWTGALEPIDAPQNYTPEELPDWLSAGEEETELEDTGETDLDYISDEPGEMFEIAPEGSEEQLGQTQPELSAEAAADSQEDIPEWLRELRPGEKPGESEEEASSLASDTQPVWAQEFDQAGFEPTPMPEEDGQEAGSPAEAIAETIEESALDEEEDDGLAWLEGLAAKQGAAEDELITEPTERDEDKPDWLKTPEEKVEEAADSLAWLDEMAAEVEGEQPQEMTEEPVRIPEPDLLAQSFPENGQISEQDSPAPVFHEAPNTPEEEGVPDWLKELGMEAAQATSTAELDQTALDQPPDWLDELRPSTDEADGSADGQDSEDEDWGADEDQATDLSKLDWLEELGAPKQVPETIANQPISQPQTGAWVPEKQLQQTPEIIEEQEPPAPEPIAEQTEAEPVPQPESSKQQQNQERLEAARMALNSGDLDAALEDYGKLARSRKLLDEIITDLESALRRHDQNITLWQTLGDAYMRGDRLREALDCYTKAEDLL